MGTAAGWSKVWVGRHSGKRRSWSQVEPRNGTKKVAQKQKRGPGGPRREPTARKSQEGKDAMLHAKNKWVACAIIHRNHRSGTPII